MLPDLIAERFKPFAILGEGGFGITYGADDLESGQQVAVKVLRMNRVDDWKAVELFEREGRTLQNLDHPRIPDYVDCHFDQESAQAYLAQELAPGKNIGQRLNEGERFDEDRALEIALKVLDVLDYLSGLSPRVIHRDIKPDNLLLDRDSLYVVDFGAVREVARQAGDGSTVAGTFGYMAPEQLRGHAAPASDIYGLAMTLIHMLSGTAPDDMEQMRMTPNFRDYTQISDGLADLLDDMSEPIIDDRIASAAECRERIEALRSTLIHAPQTTPRPARPGASIRERVEAEEARKEAAERERKRREAEAAQRARQEMVENHDRFSDALTIEKHSPNHWSMSFQPGARRRIATTGVAFFWLSILGALGILAIGIPMVTWPIIGDLHLAVALNLGVWGGFLVLTGVGILGYRLMSLRENRIRLELEDGAFLIESWGFDSPYMGRIGNLQARLESPDTHNSFAILHLDWDAGSLAVQGLTVDEMDRLQQFFTDAEVSLWD